MFYNKSQFRVFSLLVLSISFLFVSIFSFSGSGSGTVPDPYEITTCLELQEIEDNLSANYELLNDIDCSGISDFRRLGNCTGSCSFGGDGVDFPFLGNFNGNGNSISNVNLTNLTSSDNGWGFFGFMTNNIVESVSLINVIINVPNANFSVGGLIGNSRFSLILNSSFSGSVSSLVADNVGGLIGYSDNSNISNSYTLGTVVGDNLVGGLIGYGDRNNISNSYSSATVLGNDSIGGLVGYTSSSDILNSYSSGTVTGTTFVGGLTGYTYNSNILNSYSSSDVTGTTTVGGLVGSNEYYSFILNSYSSGDVSGVNNVGGLIGQNIDSDINNSFTVSDDISGTLNVGSLIGVNNLSYDSQALITNSYWLNTSNNPDVAISSNYTVQTVTPQTLLSYYYNTSNSPMNLWDSSIWNSTGLDLPYLIDVGDMIGGGSIISSTGSVTSLFPLGGIYISLFIVLTYFLF